MANGFRLPMRFHRKATFLLAVCAVLICFSFYLLVTKQSDISETKQRMVKVPKKSSGKSGQSQQEPQLAAHWNVDENVVAVKDLMGRAKKANKCFFEHVEAKTDVEVVETWDKLVDNENYSEYWHIGYGSVMKYDPKKVVEEPKLIVYVVPFSHVDPGWLKTYHQYSAQTNSVLDNIIEFLPAHPDMSFMWTEISFLWKWWEKQTPETKTKFKKLVDSGKVDITTGSWTMTDEANPYFWATIDNMIEGHQYVRTELGVNPTVSWSCDPFGYSSTIPFLFQKANASSVVINRIHRILKTFYGKHKQLDFFWRQYWDAKGEHDIFAAVLRGHHYDIPNTCGPDHSVCCQFDFKRLTHFSCSGPRPVAITEENVAERAATLYDQYRKLVQVTKTNVLLTVLGDDFRYTEIEEFHQQYDNYKQLFQYMNAQKGWNIEAKFGTFTDYFKDVRARTKSRSDFPTLSGDFFPYNDNAENIWTGYFTSRPFYKKMDRIVQAHLRGADICSSLALAKIGAEKGAQLAKAFLSVLTEVRRDLALFQHHDAITGTSKAFVMLDYGLRLWYALLKADLISAISVQILLTTSEITIPRVAPVADDGQTSFGAGAAKVAGWDFSGLMFDINSKPMNATDNSKSMPLGLRIPGDTQVVVVYNSLPHQRRQVVRILVLNPFVLVSNSQSQPVAAQINPHFASSGNAYSDVFELVFIADLPPLAVLPFTLSVLPQLPDTTQFCDIFVSPNIDVRFLPKQFGFTLLHSGSFSLKNSHIETVHDSDNGLLKGIVSKDGTYENLALDFWLYTSTQSGAYIFVPTSQANKLHFNATTVVIKGPLLSETHSFFSRIVHRVTIVNVEDAEASAVLVHNVVDLRELGNAELVMRVHTDVENENFTFYSDLNGYQNVRRKFRPTQKLETNYFPMAASAFLQDATRRVTVFSGQPLGVTAPAKGIFEIMLDRILSNDDWKGLDEAVRDNLPVSSDFAILLEPSSRKNTAEKQSSSSSNNSKNIAYHTLLGSHVFQRLLNPVLTFHQTMSRSKGGLRPFVPLRNSFPCDIQLLNMRSLNSGSGDDRLLLLHKIGQDCEYSTAEPASCWNSATSAAANLIQQLNVTNIRESSLTGLYDYEVKTAKQLLDIKVMDIKTYRIR